MKKSVALFLTLAMLATLFCGIVPVSAATGDATVTAGGTYADAVYDDEIVFKNSSDSNAADVIADNTARSLTITRTLNSGTAANYNPSGNIDLSGVNWKKTGKITLTYEATLADNMGGEVRIGMVPRVNTSSENNKHIANNGSVSEQQGQCSFVKTDANGTKIYAKSVYTFSATGIKTEIYCKKNVSDEYTKKSEFTYNATFTTDNYKFVDLEPYGANWYVSEEGADNIYTIVLSNIVLTESYDDAQLQSFSNTHYADESLDINFRLPEGYTSASLSIGGNKIADMKASDKPAGGYVATADVSSLDWYGNMKAVLDIDINDGTSKKLSSDIKIVNGPDKTSYGKEDFEDEDYAYSHTTAPVANCAFDDVIQNLNDGVHGKVFGLKTKEAYAKDGANVIDAIGNIDVAELDFSSPYMSDSTCVDIEFDAYLQNLNSTLGLHIKDNGGNTTSNGDYHYWDYLIGYYKEINTALSDNGTSLSNNEILDQWKHYKFTIDSKTDKVYIYIDGEKVVEKKVTDGDKEEEINLNGFKLVSLAARVTNANALQSEIYIDNVEIKTYESGDKPAIDSISVGEGNAISVKFDKAVTVAANAITLKCGGSNIASSVAYDEATITATITPSDTLTALNGTVEIADSVAGYAMSVPVDFAVDMPFITNAKLENKGDGRYEGTVDVYNDKAEEKLGAVYVAVYNGTALEGVAKAVINSVDGKTTITCPLTLSDASSASAAYTAKMFVWNNALKPILDVVK